MKIGISIASSWDRRDYLGDLRKSIDDQSYFNHEIYTFVDPTDTNVGEKRNGHAKLFYDNGIELAVFLDDDILLCEGYLESLSIYFSAKRNRWNILTGTSLPYLERIFGKDKLDVEVDVPVLRDNYCLRVETLWIVTGKH